MTTNNLLTDEMTGEPGVDDTAADGTAADGTAADGTAADGTAADGAAADGAAADGAAAVAPPARRRLLPRFDLSVTQLIATGLAATTATFAASYLGVAGTVIGAALASVLTAIGNVVYGQSLRSTRDHVREVVPTTRLLPRVPATSTAVTSTAATSTAVSPRLTAGAEDEIPVLPEPAPRSHGVLGWRRVAIGAVAVFVAVMALVTTVELATGRPLSDVVRGDTGRGTSFFGGEQSNNGPAPVTTPTVTRTIIPKLVLTTPTITQTAPAVTKTSTPTNTVSPSVSGTTHASHATTTPSSSRTSPTSRTPAP